MSEEWQKIPIKDWDSLKDELKGTHLSLIIERIEKLETKPCMKIEKIFTNEEIKALRVLKEIVRDNTGILNVHRDEIDKLEEKLNLQNKVLIDSIDFSNLLLELFLNAGIIDEENHQRAYNEIVKMRKRLSGEKSESASYVSIMPEIYPSLRGSNSKPSESLEARMNKKGLYKKHGYLYTNTTEPSTEKPKDDCKHEFDLLEAFLKREKDLLSNILKFVRSRRCDPQESAIDSLNRIRDYIKNQIEKY